MGIVTTIILVIFLGDFAWWWKARRLLRTAPGRNWWRLGLAVFFIVQIGGLLAIIASRSPDLQWAALSSRPLISAVYIWHLLILPVLLIGWLCAAIVQLIALAARQLRSRPGPAAEPVHESGFTRRAFLATSIAAAPAVLALGATGVALPQLRQFRIRRFDVALPQLPLALDGLTIAHVSDLHVGRFTKGRVLEDIVQATNDLAVDLVLHTGDLINHALSDLPAALEVVKAIHGRHGSFICEGNHDLIENGREFRNRTRAAGVPLLINESALLTIRGEPVQILGLRWGAGAARPRAEQRSEGAIANSMKELLAQRRSGAFPILLAHHPHSFDYAEDIPLTLVGHTHGGQLMVTPETGFGPLLYRYWSGLYRKDQRALSVSNGVGNWFPLRTRAPAEIIHLTLRKA